MTEANAICGRCGGANGRHGLVHVRHGNGGGHNEPCPRTMSMTIADYHATRESGRGCPATDGGAHYFAFIDPSVDHRICIDCGAPESCS